MQAHAAGTLCTALYSLRIPEIKKLRGCCFTLIQGHQEIRVYVIVEEN
jgi:hypothetical protein